MRLPFAWAKGVIENGFKPAYRPLPASADVHTYAVYDLAPGEAGDLRIVLLSDWGTGSDQALALVAKLVQRARPHLCVHLGDVYYSGTPWEQEHNFTKVMRQAVPEEVPIFNIPGNHDYYSGGHGFFEQLPKLNAVQQSSFFCLRGAAWQIVFLDTGINDSNPIDTALNATATYLDDGQARWAKVMIEDGKQNNLKTIMMSHHQLFSRREHIGKTSEGVNPHLYATFKEMLPDIHAWFWGHEHALSIFQPFLGLRRGRLIGNGSVPEWSSVDVFAPSPHIDWSKYGGVPPTVVPGTTYGNSGMLWDTCGVTLTLSGSSAKVDYLQMPQLSLGNYGELALVHSEMF